MPHASTVQDPTQGEDLVTLSFSVPADKVSAGADEVFIHTGTNGTIRVPKTLMSDSGESGYVVFQTRVPSDVAVAVTRVCAELFRLTDTDSHVTGGPGSVT
jgi:hypothetical protein